MGRGRARRRRCGLQLRRDEGNRRPLLPKLSRNTEAARVTARTDAGPGAGRIRSSDHARVVFSLGPSCSRANGPGWCRPPGSQAEPTAAPAQAGPTAGAASRERSGHLRANGRSPEAKLHRMVSCLRSALDRLPPAVQKLHRPTLHRPEPPVREPGHGRQGNAALRSHTMADMPAEPRF